MAAKWSAIPAQEVHNTRREWFDSDGRFFASATLMCVWEDRFKLIQDLYTSNWGPLAPLAATGYNPRVWPDPGGGSGLGDLGPPAMSKIGITSATFRSWAEIAKDRASDGEVLDYRTNAFVDVQYGRHYNIQESIDFNVEAITQSQLDFKWKTNLGTWDQGLVKELEVPIATLYSAILTRDFIGLAPKSPLPDAAPLTPDLSTLIECVGKVNHEEYVSLQLGKTFKKGTLLMMEPELRPSLDMQNFDPDNFFGAQGFSVVLKFLYKEGGDAQGEDINTHNLFWRPAKNYGEGANIFHGDWDRLLVPIPGLKKYDLRDPWKEYHS